MFKQWKTLLLPDCRVLGASWSFFRNILPEDLCIPFPFTGEGAIINPVVGYKQQTCNHRYAEWWLV